MPVVFGLAGCGLGFAWLGVHLDVMPAALITALPLRVFGIMASELLLAIPFFTFMGLVLDRSGLAEEVLETAGELSGGLRGGLALSVIAVGALLAATTGVVAAAVISIGTVSLPVMLRRGYNPRIAAGVVAAAGGLTQIVPPSLSLIVLADQLGRGVGEMYAAALVPAALIIVCYAALVAVLALLRPAWLPGVAADPGRSACAPPRGQPGRMGPACICRHCRRVGGLDALSGVDAGVGARVRAAARRACNRRGGHRGVHRHRRSGGRPPVSHRLVVAADAARGLGVRAAACADLPGARHDLRRRWPRRPRPAPWAPSAP